MYLIPQRKINELITQYQKTGKHDYKYDAANVHYPSTEEPVLIHPFNQSMVKLRNNGNIDIFVDNNIGIRVDSKYQSINLISDGIYERTQYIRSYVTKDEVRRVKGDWKIEAGSASITTKGNTTVYSKSDTNIFSLGNTYVQANKETHINANETLNINAKNINITASENLNAYAKQYNWS